MVKPPFADAEPEKGDLPEIPDVPPAMAERPAQILRAKDKRKQSLYFPSNMLTEIQAEAKRLDRSLSWVVQYAWMHGREKVKQLPRHDL